MQAKKEIFQVSGDQSTGVSSSANLINNTLCKPVVLYRSREMGDLFLTIDVFALPGTPMYAVIRCPICQARNPDSKGMDLTIKEDKKSIDLDHKAIPRYPGYTTAEIVNALGLQSVDELRGRISIEPFKCTWEETPDLKRDFGLSRCPWSISITNNIAKDE